MKCLAGNPDASRHDESLKPYDLMADGPENTDDCRAIEHVADPELRVTYDSCHCHEWLSDCEPYENSGPHVKDGAGLDWHIVSPCKVA